MSVYIRIYLYLCMYKYIYYFCVCVCVCDAVQLLFHILLIYNKLFYIPLYINILFCNYAYLATRALSY